MTYPPILHWRVGLAALVLALAAVATARAQGVAVAMLPETLVVSPGDTFTVQVALPAATSAINGYDAALGYDPNVLTLLTRPKASQESAWFHNVCGNTFYVFQAAADSASWTDILLCNAASLTGPGTLFSLQFVAGPTRQATTLHFRHATFYNGGLWVLPVTTTDAVVAIGVTLDVPRAGGASPPRRLRVSPNPSRGAVSLELVGAPPAPGVTFVVCDVAGREVRRLDVGAGPARVAWDGRDAQGRTVAPGVYRAVLRASGGDAVGATLVRLR